MTDPEGATQALAQPGEMEINPLREGFEDARSEAGEIQSDAAVNDETLANIYTAVPIFKKQDDEKIGLEIQVFQGDDDDDDTDTSSPLVSQHTKKPLLLQSCKKYSLGLGIVIGSFIQLSCMGSLILYTAFASRLELHRLLHLNGTRSQIMFFSFVWSAITSSIGFLIMMLLSRLFQQLVVNVNNKRSDSFLLHMELYVATGAVLGVSIAWTAKNLLVGGNVYLWQSMFTFGVAFLYAVVVKHLLLRAAKTASNEQDETTKLLEPLLPMDASAPSSDSRRDLEGCVQKHSLGLGFLVGCLIQVSSLAAHCLIEPQYHTGNNSGNGNGNGTRFLVLNLLWDALTSTMGVATLLLVRRLLELKLTAASDNSSSSSSLSLVPARSSSSSSSSTARILFQFESRFSMGSLVGVNLAWMATDLLLGLKNLMGQCLVTLIVSLVWFRAIQNKENNENDDANSEKDKDHGAIQVV